MTFWGTSFSSGPGVLRSELCPLFVGISSGWPGTSKSERVGLLSTYECEGGQPSPDADGSTTADPSSHVPQCRAVPHLVECAIQEKEHLQTAGKVTYGAHRPLREGPQPKPGSERGPWLETPACHRCIRHKGQGRQRPDLTAGSSH
jgi:hypothetical protein